jgi:CPA1 family monovalent cation:H+ antiporter
LKRTRTFSPGVIRILTWGGLRGGISVALALALPKDESLEEGARQAILMATYVIVIFSIAVQGLTLKPVISRLMKAPG